MNKYFVRDTPLAELERMMMAVPNFAPRGSAHAVLCHYQPQAADMDCRNCLQYRRGCQSMMCLYLTERLQAGAVTMEELIPPLIRDAGDAVRDSLGVSFSTLTVTVQVAVASLWLLSPL